MKNEELQEKTDLLLAETIALGFNSKKYVDWAIELMLDSYSFEELNILAGMDEKDSREIECYFRQACQKLGINTEQDKIILVKNYISYIARKVLAREIDPRKAQAIVAGLYCELDYPQEFMPIVYAEDCWCLAEFKEAEGDQYEKFLVNEFRLYLEEN